MTPRPRLVAFDVIETLFSIEALRPRLVRAGLAGETLELWFASGLRDAFALAATQSYSPFAQVLQQALMSLARKLDRPIGRSEAETVVAGFAELEPRADVETAFERLREAGVRIATLSNGAAETTKALLSRAGLEDLVELSISVDEVGTFKPDARVYRHAAERAGLPPSSVALVAAHVWDVHGAKSAGLTTGLVGTATDPPDPFRRPDVVGDSLMSVVEQLL